MSLLLATDGTHSIVTITVRFINVVDVANSLIEVGGVQTYFLCSGQEIKYDQVSALCYCRFNYQSNNLGKDSCLIEFSKKATYKLAKAR
jgi:hypothetical protein